MNQLFLLCPAIAINENRTEQKRHFCCCALRVKSKESYRKRSKCFIQCFAGHQPKSRDDVESPMEKYPKRLMYLILQAKIGKLAVALMFLIYIVSSIYGTLNLKRGLDTYNLVSKDSYYYKYGIWDKTYFTSEPLVSVFIKDNHRYHSPYFQSNLRSLILTVMKDKKIDDNFEINWLEAYKISPFYTNASENNFTVGLVNFLLSPQGQMYSNDIVINKTNLEILSSKIHLKTFDLKTSEEKGDFMIRIRHIEKQAPFHCIIFSPIFILCEQYIKIMPTTLQTVGITLVVILFIKFLFMPMLLVVFVVAMTLLSIIVGIFGFMYYWDLSLNSMTMIHLVMSVGFSVDFSVHICHAFLSLRCDDRDEVLRKTLDVTGGPIFNAALSSMLGVIILILSNNYVFLCFGILMFMVLGFGLFHACLFLPLFLYFLMPCFLKQDKNNAIGPRKGTVELNHLETFTIYDPKLFKSKANLNNFFAGCDESEFIPNKTESVPPN